MGTVILHLDTSGNSCEVSMFCDGVLKVSFGLHSPNVHSEWLGTLVDRVLEAGGVSSTEITHGAIVSGPGSYTGLRIGFAFMKGFCMARGIPLMTYSRLLGHAHSYLPLADLLQRNILSVLEANAQEIYAELYNAQGKIIKHLGLVSYNDEHFHALLNQSSLLILGHSLKLQSMLETDPFQHTHLYVPEPVKEKKAIGKILEEKIANQDYASLVLAEPVYLKEAHITMKKKPCLRK